MRKFQSQIRPPRATGKKTALGVLVCEEAWKGERNKERESGGRKETCIHRNNEKSAPMEKPTRLELVLERSRDSPTDRGASNISDW